MNRLLFLLGLALWGVLPVAAQAQVSDDERARNHFDAARSYYEQGRYEDAEREFAESYRLSRRSPLLVNIATARERAQNLAGAIEALEEYLRVEPDADDRVTIETRVQSLRARIDGTAPETETEAETETAVERSPETRRPSAPAADDSLATAGYVTLGAAGAIGLISLVTGLAGNAIYEDLVSDCPNGVCPESRRGDADTSWGLAVTSTVTMFVAAAAGVAGIVLVLLPLTSGGESARAGLRIAPGPGDVGLALEVEL